MSCTHRVKLLIEHGTERSTGTEPVGDAIYSFLLKALAGLRCSRVVPGHVQRHTQLRGQAEKYPNDKSPPPPPPLPPSPLYTLRPESSWNTVLNELSLASAISLYN